MTERPCRHPEPGSGPAMMYAQQVSGPQLSHLSSQGVTLDDFQSTFWLRCSVSMNQLPKLVSFVWVIETMATELSSLTLAFLEGLCHPPPGPCPRLGSQGTPRDIPEGWCDCCTTKWDSPSYPTRGERISTGRCKVGIGGEHRMGPPCPQGSFLGFLISAQALQGTHGLSLLDQRPPVALPPLETWLSGLRAGSQFPKGPSMFQGQLH